MGTNLTDLCLFRVESTFFSEWQALAQCFEYDMRNFVVDFAHFDTNSF